MDKLAGALHRHVAAFLLAVDVAQLRCTCAVLRATLGHDPLWQGLFRREWGDPDESDLTEGRSWAELFAGRAAQRQRWRRHEYLQRHSFRVFAYEGHYDMVVHASTLFVTTSMERVRVFALPALESLVTWQLRDRAVSYTPDLWLCGTGQQARLVLRGADGPLLCWRPTALAGAPSVDGAPPLPVRPLPPPELVLQVPPRMPWAIRALFFDDVRHTAIAIYEYATVLEWSRETGACLRQLALWPRASGPLGRVLYNGTSLFAKGRELRLYADNPSLCSAQPHVLWHALPLRHLLDLEMYWTNWRQPVVLDRAPPVVVSDLWRPSGAWMPALSEPLCHDMGRRLQALFGLTTPVFDVACNARFLVLLGRDETLLALDYGPPLPTGFSKPPFWNANLSSHERVRF